MYQVVEAFLKGKSYVEFPIPTKRKHRKEIFIFHMNLPNCFIWLTKFIRTLMSLIFTTLHSLHQHGYGHLILSRSSDYQIWRISRRPCSTLRYVNLFILVIVKDPNWFASSMASCIQWTTVNIETSGSWSWLSDQHVLTHQIALHLCWVLWF
jgi:hypothetical protein